METSKLKNNFLQSGTYKHASIQDVLTKLVRLDIYQRERAIYAHSKTLRCNNDDTFDVCVSMCCSYSSLFLHTKQKIFNNSFNATLTFSMIYAYSRLNAIHLLCHSIKLKRNDVRQSKTNGSFLGYRYMKYMAYLNIS